MGIPHEGFVNVSETWKSVELKPYQHLITQPYGCPMVMMAHVVNKNLDAKGLPASLSIEMIEGWLRKQLHFEGIVVSDDMQMKAIVDHYGLREALRLAIRRE